MGNRRSERTREKLKDALLELMGEKPCSQVCVAELCRQAGVSRSTFYAHYDGVHSVLQELMSDFSSAVMPLQERLHCGDCIPGRRAYCVRLREAGRFAPLVADPAYRATVRSGEGYGEVAGLAATLADSDVDPEIARAIQLFQENGCYAVATAVPADADWPKIQAALDRFIRAGIAALRQA